MSTPPSPLEDFGQNPSLRYWQYRDPIQAYITDVLREPEYIRLLSLKDQGWKDEDLEQNYVHRRRANWQYERQPTFDPQKNPFFQKGIKVMEELDLCSRLVHRFRPLSFLDICCCPGGFSQYILQKNRLAEGRGLSLPPSEGHSLSIADPELYRFQITYQDITRYDFYTDFLSEDDIATLPTPVSSLNLVPLPTFALQDIIMADGQVLRDYNAPISESFADRPAGFSPYSSLLYAQLVLGLIFLHPGGTFVVKTTHSDRYYTIRLIQKLRSVASSVTCFKPTSCWADRSSFYIILKGVRTESSECIELVKTWVKRLYYLTSGNKIPKEMNVETMWKKELEAAKNGEIAEIAPMLRQVWKAQAEGMEWKLHKRSRW